MTKTIIAALVLMGIVIGLWVFTNTQKTDQDTVGSSNGDTTANTPPLPNTRTSTEPRAESSLPATLVLDLSNQGLTKVPNEVFTSSDSVELNLSGNTLTGALPAEVRHLQNLKILNLSNNQFTGVPAEIGQLKNLEVLDLSNNKITGLPQELGNLSNLKTLKISGNDYSKADLEGIKSSLPNTVVIDVD